MRIPVVRTILFRAPRRANDFPACGNPSGLGIRAKRWLAGWVRRTWAALEGLLLRSHRLYGCKRVGLPVLRTIFLRANETLRITPDSGVTCVEVRRGIVWLTGSPAKGDVLLHPGDRFALVRDWPFVVQAMGSAEIILLP